MTHAEKVLALLSDGEPHTHMEGYRLGVMLHSRVADLRRRGYEIKCWHENGLYLYQLFGTVREPGAVAAAALAAFSDPPAFGPSLTSGGLAHLGPSAEAAAATPPLSPGRAQLLIWEAA